MAGYYVKPSLPYFGTHYESRNGEVDLYYLFLERALRVLAPTGRVGMIVPKQVLPYPPATTERSARSRPTPGSHRGLWSGTSLLTATNYSCILSFGRAVSSEVGVSRVTADLIATDTFTVSSDSLSSAPWTLAGDQDGRGVRPYAGGKHPLKELTSHFGNGVQTGQTPSTSSLVHGGARSTLSQVRSSRSSQGRDVRRYAAGASARRSSSPSKKPATATR